ncbi:hypothetical protein OSB04_022768 [Centaurea solstitialis]|uniref:Pectinesterase inhibitor domain-containing protein n=1 Tax=Centaurea solstitialis TaxID=347529 RepID=A0AA38SW72_9ASTR|nr:hypothetical protein OSB04_022768 [Centaurea solstitialis]
MQTNKRVLFAFCALFLLAFAISSISKLTNNHHELSLFTQTTPKQIHLFKHIQTQTAHTHCQGSLYYQQCLETLTAILPELRSKSLPEIISATINRTMTDVKLADFNVTAIRRKLRNLSPIEIRALDDCHSLLVETAAHLDSAIADLRRPPYNKHNDLRTLLSAAMTNQATCLDGFAVGKSREKVRRYFRKSLRDISRQVSNSLALLTRMNGTTSSVPEYRGMAGGFPRWVGKKERALLQAPAAAEAEYDLVVAKDGSGDFTTIGEALSAAPNGSTTRFVIYIKSGAYYEYLEIDSRKTMVMLVGDGIGKTLIKGNRSVVDGWTTFRSATVVAVGNNFIAKGITFENFAGIAKRQAVALRSASSASKTRSTSTPSASSSENATSTAPSTSSSATRPSCSRNRTSTLVNRIGIRKNVFTAQSRDDPNQNTGISILECKIAAGSELIPNQTMFKSYLGRPWREYSRTVIMRSYIGDLIDPAGWLEWSGDFGLSTLYYGEYMNRGPGSNTNGRVSWPGYRVIVNTTEAGQFTAGNFIQGGDWLNTTGVPYYLGLN